jgi:hypothetical protein
MKFATGETDTGVIISWHAEGPKNVEANLPIPSVVIMKNGIVINPLNWKLAGPQCYHQDDYSIFYNNIKDNVAKRIAAYNAK